jgi:FlaG/FlaF family flagellin (archaellin)
VAVTAVLGATVAGLVAAHGVGAAPPQAHLSVTVDATDGYPDGQQIRLTHEGGDPLAVRDLALVVTVEGGVHARLTGFPTRRLTADNVAGDHVFDRSYAGVDGAVDAAHTDGRWTAGERATVRVAQTDLDVQSGDSVTVRVVHRPTGATLVAATVRATGA